MTSPSRRVRGFTLVEALVVVSIVVLIMSITLPMLKASRWSAIRLAQASHQRQVGVILRHYTDDHDGRFPYWGTPGSDWAPLVVYGRMITHSHWTHPEYWPVYIASLGYDGRSARRVGAGVCADAESPPAVEDWLGGVHVLSDTCFASNEYFSERGPHDASQYRGRRMEHVAFPSAKGLLWQRGCLAEGESIDLLTPWLRWVVTFADGHAETPRVDELRPGIAVGKFQPGLQVLNTVDGLGGRDL